jgi:hypothetical protein
MTTPNAELAGIDEGGRALRILKPLVRRYQWVARREMLACAAILVLTLGLRAALLPWLPVPQPSVHDEFSYLLAADTYAHGRLTNPPHPFWQHFETFHVLQQPTYASKYQPLQGLVLAFGQKFFGQPWIGVYLSTGLMCAAICWMLQGWISPDWALLGALLCALRVGVLSYWMNSYMGGAVPAMGGALALGAVVRIWRRRQFSHSITWALGVAMVVLSRPYDAAVLGCATSAMLVWFLRKSGTSARTVCIRVGLPALVVFAACAGFIAYNDYRVTGHALTLPYQAYEQQYGMVSMFTMMPLGSEPPYRHAAMRQFYADWNVGQRTLARSLPIAALVVKSVAFVNFFFPFWAVMILVLLCPYDLNTAEERATVFLLVVFVFMIAPLIASQPHYVAIFAGVFYLRFLHGLSRLWLWRPRGKPVGQMLGLVLLALLIGEDLRFTSGGDQFSQVMVVHASRLGVPRQSMTQTLTKGPGRHLVMVRYSPEHNPHEEWVFNSADIDASPIVWAREMGPEQDRPFIDHFHGRRVWLLEPDHSPPRLSPYSARELPQP